MTSTLIKSIFRLFFASRKTHFLLVFQNNNELRSTGGYLTSVLDVTLGRGWFKKKFLNVNTDLYQHEKVQAPKVIEEMLYDGHLKTWTFRDSNYSPDFMVSAQKMIEFYNRIYPQQKVAGLLTVNFSFVEALLHLLGAIKVKRDSLDSTKLFTYLTASTSDIDRHDKKALDERKNILKEVFKALFLACLKRPWKGFKIFRLMNHSFKTKDLQFFDSKKPTSSFYAEKDQDVLALIENNYLGLKSNRFIQRSVEHHSLLDEAGVLKNSLKIQWHHLGSYDYPISGHYRGHVRIYLNSEAQVSTPSEGDIEKEDGFLVLSFKLNLNPQSSKTVVLEYQLPPSFAEMAYRFKFIKQSGVSHENLKKTFTLPKSLSFLEAEKMSWVNGVATADFSSLATDLNLELQFKKNQNHPRIHAHEIISPNAILIKFNEAVELNQAIIKVWKKGDPSHLLEVETLETLQNHQWLKIILKDLPSAHEIFYTVSLENILNKNGQSLQPNPRKVTVVYRPKYFPYWQRQLSGLTHHKKISSSQLTPQISNSYYPAGHYHSPLVDLQEMQKREAELWPENQLVSIPGIHLNVGEQLELLKNLATFYEQMPFNENKTKNLRYYFQNMWYSYTDGILLYAMMRHFQPRRIVEVGSGFSSAIMLDVNELFFNNDIELTFIEPYPERLFSLMNDLDRKRSKVLDVPLQQVPLEIFQSLEAGDMLFVDSSHVVKTGSDVHHLLFNILPHLKPGVLIHFHDIFYPFEYPKTWVMEGRNWNENYFLRAFLSHNHHFKIKLFSHYLHKQHPHAFAQMPLSYKNPGGQLWIEKTG